MTPRPKSKDFHTDTSIGKSQSLDISIRIKQKAGETSEAYSKAPWRMLTIERKYLPADLQCLITYLITL